LINQKKHHSDLGGLADPSQFVEPINIEGINFDTLMAYLRSMQLIRYTEEQIGELVKEGVAKTPCHLSIGQEAIAVGVASSLNSSDRVFGNHRSHSHFLALGGDAYSLIAEVLGRVDGASNGMGGSMHLYGASVGFQGSVPLVGATIPIAVGAALAAKMGGGDEVAVAFFGDGAAEEGVFHESLNFASIYELPILFVVENNLFSSHLHIQLRQPSDSIARFADAHRIRNKVIDGNDVISVAIAAEELILAARKGGGPALLEVVTFRFRGHVGPNEDIDVGVHREMKDVEAWKQRCPIKRLRIAMENEGLLTEEQFNEQSTAVLSQVQLAVETAKSSPYPNENNLLDFVYSRSDHS
jgi:TPP-dependent pyruvate/acetoin dehydrogenase alpha subunit